jgi:hypothetical protein
MRWEISNSGNIHFLIIPDCGCDSLLDSHAAIQQLGSIFQCRLFPYCPNGKPYQELNIYLYFTTLAEAKNDIWSVFE